MILRRALYLASELVPSPPVTSYRVLTYHSVSSGPCSVDIPPVEFEEQVKWLADTFSIVSMADLVAGPSPESNRLALTFDDGYSDYLQRAVPILQHYRIPSTVYVVTNHVANPALRFPFRAGEGKTSMTASDIESIRGVSGITVGSHTCSHRALNRLATSDAERELLESCRVIRELTGASDVHFCYPWGLWRPDAESLVRQTYASAVTGVGGVNSPGQDIYRLRRIPVKREPLQMFKRRILSGATVESWLRRARDAGRMLTGTACGGA